MNDSRIDADTAERLLRGEPVGPPEIVALLAAASAEAAPDGAAVEGQAGEEAAVAAFRDAWSGRAQRRARPPSLRARLVTVRTVLIACLLLLLAGGVAAAATSGHVPGPFGDQHVRSRTPVAPRTTRTSSSPVTQHNGPRRQTGHHKPPAEKAHLPNKTKRKPDKPHAPHSHVSPSPQGGQGERTGPSAKPHHR